jgi:hypothetical protein
MHPFQVGAVAQHRIAGLREDAAERRRAATAARPGASSSGTARAGS